MQEISERVPQVREHYLRKLPRPFLDGLQFVEIFVFWSSKARLLAAKRCMLTIAGREIDDVLIATTYF